MPCPCPGIDTGDPLDGGIMCESESERGGSWSEGRGRGAARDPGVGVEWDSWDGLRPSCEGGGTLPVPLPVVKPLEVGMEGFKPPAPDPIPIPIPMDGMLGIDGTLGIATPAPTPGIISTVDPSIATSSASSSGGGVSARGLSMWV